MENTQVAQSYSNIGNSEEEIRNYFSQLQSQDINNLCIEEVCEKMGKSIKSLLKSNIRQVRYYGFFVPRTVYAQAMLGTPISYLRKR